VLAAHVSLRHADDRASYDDVSIFASPRIIPRASHETRGPQLTPDGLPVTIEPLLAQPVGLCQSPIPLSPLFVVSANTGARPMFFHQGLGIIAIQPLQVR
jgi:hypothetical protein